MTSTNGPIVSDAATQGAAPFALTRNRVALALLAAALIFCYLDVFALLLRQWSADNAYSHGYIVVPISAWLAYTRARRITGRASAWARLAGALLMVAGLGLLTLGHAANMASPQEVSLLVVLAGLVLLIAGVSGLRAMWLPIAYLVMMMPVLNVVTGRLHGPFQLFSAMVGSRVLRAVGVPVFVEGIYLHLPSVTLEVAKVCSGVNYLVAVLALGIPYATISFTSIWRRVALLAFAVSVAILSNSLRVALIGYLNYRGWAGDTHGPWHVLQGLSVAMVGYVALFVGARVLEVWPRPRNRATAPPPQGALLPRAQPALGRGAVLFACAALILGGAVPRVLASTPPPEQRLAALPERIGAWHRARVPPPAWPAALGDASEGRSWSTYAHPDGARVTVFLAAYRSSAEGGAGASFWTDNLDAWSTVAPVQIPSAGAVPVNRLGLPGRGRGIVGSYWYVIDGRTTPSRVRAKVASLWALVLRRETGPVAVLVASPPGGTADTTATRRVIDAFTVEAWPAISIAAAAQ